MLHFERTFQQCDVIVTPATPMTAPDIPDAVLHSSGSYDLACTFETILFTQVGTSLYRRAQNMHMDNVCLC
jgi:Asp-tRNA(Asn)/Glu-tRNA(Gln) amidotransferase A subunit family amidase